MNMQKIKEALTNLFEELDPSGEIIPDNKKQEVLQAIDKAQEDMIKQAEQDAEKKIACQNSDESSVEKIQQEFDAKLKEKEDAIAELKQEYEKKLNDAQQKACAAIDVIKQEQQKQIQDVIAQQQQLSADEIVKVQQDQQEQDEKIAMLKTQELIDGIQKQHKSEIDALENDINEHLNTFLNSKADLQLKVNAVAENNNYRNVIGKIRDLLIEAEVFNKTVDVKAKNINEADRRNANEAIAKSIELKKMNESLEEKNAELENKLYLSERVQILPTRIASIVVERLSGKSKYEIDDLFDHIVESAEAELEDVKANRRASLHNAHIDKTIVEDIEHVSSNVNDVKSKNVGDLWAAIM